jgi:hypothetical protein
MPNDSQHLIDRFRKACKPPGVFEMTEMFTDLALKELRDESKPQREKYNSAIRLLCCIPTISDSLSDSAKNEIFSREGVALPCEILTSSIG